MPKSYKAVPLPKSAETQGEPVTVSSETDFDALDRAKQILGSDVPFELWDDARLALTYKPLVKAALSAKRETGSTR